MLFANKNEPLLGLIPNALVRALMTRTVGKWPLEHFLSPVPEAARAAW